MTMLQETIRPEVRPLCPGEAGRWEGMTSKTDLGSGSDEWSPGGESQRQAHVRRSRGAPVCCGGDGIASHLAGFSGIARLKLPPARESR